MNDIERRSKRRRNATRTTIITGVPIVIVAAVAIGVVATTIFAKNKPIDMCHAFIDNFYTENFDTDLTARTAASSEIIIAKIESVVDESIDPLPTTTYQSTATITLRGNLSGNVKVLQGGVEGCTPQNGQILTSGQAYLFFLIGPVRNTRDTYYSQWTSPSPVTDEVVAQVNKDHAKSELSHVISEIARTPYKPPTQPS